jgi:hypothetical protein
MLHENEATDVNFIDIKVLGRKSARFSTLLNGAPISLFPFAGIS